jgi:hypothetical protein
MDKTRINQELKDLEQQQQAKLDELKGLFTNRFADYGIIEQSILGKVAISLLRFRPDPSLPASQPKFRAMLWHNTVWLVLIAPYEIGEHEAMLWLSPSLAEGEYYFQKAYDQCEEWQLSDGEYEENESQMDSEELKKQGQLFREEMERIGNWSVRSPKRRPKSGGSGYCTARNNDRTTQVDGSPALMSRCAIT